MSAPFKTVSILDVPFINTTNAAFVTQLQTDILAHQNRFVVTANPEILMYAREHPDYQQVLTQADYITPDGIGVIQGAQILGTPLPERITGYDTLLSLLTWGAQHQQRIFLLGAKPAVLKQVVEKVKDTYPGLVIAGALDGYFQDADAVVNQIAAAKPDMIFVATGFPKQEFFIAKYRHRVAGLWMGVGGSFDVLAGAVKRAPKFWQDHHIEWLYRLIKEPSRFKRMLVLPRYLRLVKKIAKNQA
ncbi:WecB/TagA/CpsF family glycosyltransferase [Lactiplantibacillus mudanjiangensis]|uniref:N-acetylglucosaminyldiphosphoundecaprenol N-acetyl-beta-D-mannosaminyltransferase n=1 Tax=Lactiplantibacillus mudanjiangensis TaxID=1296538 RepID=A0A660DYX7_9LACO|nr:WecB/TagA/CpsF family glycosyltransferase [Lactiplantibacillus mudanjiangensis]VDG18071.1 teichoic acid biosynthesis protein A [Lactobacillus plantarum JDM1] [Lactiplantibacillus mudanjiangensis]VDG24759.1 teichoic acid biosynthesis protein A [Lactobacillus plantarum JDM1] [Lactiplantibacillus mudanjiangensis]VDG28492.1 teichoic acid biosynthesis protein A [Lactobacillus plantarum JDM1] [Lactiplantibacillus mudanjiangensis]VDG31354.1 teichoic acid biosynthesis protein A [Lactobacillus planta